MRLSKSNEHGSKISVIAVDTSRALDNLAPWATVFVHREPNYCKQYSNVSRASFTRAQKAQIAILERKEQP